MPIEICLISWQEYYQVIKEIMKFITIKLIKAFLDNNEFYQLSNFECPDCSCIEDDQYHCTICEGNSLSFSTIVEALLAKNFNEKYEYSFCLKEIVDNNEHTHSCEGITIFYEEYKTLISKEDFI